MMMTSVRWLNGAGSGGSGNGGWGAFSPNVGSFSSSGGSWGGGWGSSGLGGFGASFGGDSAGFGGGVARTFDQVGGGGGDRSGNRYDANGFGIANEGRPGDAQPSDGTQQPADTPITDFGTMEVVARRPDSTQTSDQTRRNIQGLFDPSATAPTDLGERVVVTAPRRRDSDPPPLIPSDDYHPRERSHDPGIPTLDRVVAEKPSKSELDAYNDAVVKETLRRDQGWIFTNLTGEFGAAYSALKSLFNRDWLGAAWSGLGLAGLGLGPTLRIGGRVIRNSSLAGDVHPVTGIPFRKTGFADFSGVAIKEVKITQTGVRQADFDAANRAAGLQGTPVGYTWHHVEDGMTMQLVPYEVHRLTGHTGGVALGGVR